VAVISRACNPGVGVRGPPPSRDTGLDQLFQQLADPGIGGPHRGGDRRVVGDQGSRFHQHPAGLPLVDDVGADRGHHSPQHPPGRKTLHSRQLNDLRIDPVSQRAVPRVVQRDVQVLLAGEVQGAFGQPACAATSAMVVAC
jgi:hypothetical protein